MKLTLCEGQRVGAYGVQSHQVLPVLGAAALVLQPAAEEGPAGGGRQRLVGATVVLHVGHAVPPVELLVHPDGGTEIFKGKVQNV